MSFWISGWGTQGRCRYSAVSLITRFDFMAPVTRVITALQCIIRKEEYTQSQIMESTELSDEIAFS